MAIVGLHNVPVVEPTILRESQSSSSSRQNGNQRRISTSAILQMWRELEDECAMNHTNERVRLRSQQENSDTLSNCQEEVARGSLEDLSESENGSVNNLESQTGFLNDHEDRQSVISEQSQDLGEVERERVRQIFHEWMNNGVSSQRSNVPLIRRSSRGQLLGESERERVRIVRDWIQMTSEQRDALVANREEQTGVRGSQTERVGDDRIEGRAESSRRGFRRLCGRQPLLDLLAKREQERRLELKHLEETQPVSCFAHRNRIQSLLRIKSFQYMRSLELTRPSSVAETELGLLRRRQTVSGLREGFLSRCNNHGNIQSSDISEGPSSSRTDCLREDPMEGGGNIAHELSQPIGDRDVGSSADADPLPGCSIGESNIAHMAVQVEETQDHALEHGEQSRLEAAMTCHPNGSSDHGIPMLNPQEPLSIESRESDNHEELLESHSQQYDTDKQETSTHNQSDAVEGHVSEDANVQESNIQVEDQQGHITEYEEREWDVSVLSNQRRDDDQFETDRQQWPDDGEESSHGVSENGREQNDVQEEHWHEDASQETPRDWMGMPSGPGATSSGRDDTYYFSDDDNLYNIELRELLNRRTVSSLLHSGFRESLDQLIQSYVERQTSVPDDWELHEMSPPPFAAHHQERLGMTDFNEPGVESQNMVRRTPGVRQGHRRRTSDHANWSRHEMRQRPGTEWEVINDLRIDMARLQQRLNNMQSMLEACMDMQLELQRSVRQEVSAALNRSTNQSESLDSIPPRDSMKWDCVRKGICCICSDSNIDSLLYRCGHMCTCTKCADLLVQGDGKCPMCQAPIIELIRAYFIQ